VAYRWYGVVVWTLAAFAIGIAIGAGFAAAGW
jgi:hypothetical protein